MKQTLKNAAGSLLLTAALLAFLPGNVTGQNSDQALKLEVVAEKEVARSMGAATSTELLPALETVAGDVLVYTVKFANLSDGPLQSACIVDPIPTSTVFLEAMPNSASATAEISVDGGHVFAVPPIFAPAANGNGPTEIPPTFYTHIRWSLPEPLAKGANGEFKFKVRVK